jgi:hypothetical protein
VNAAVEALYHTGIEYADIWDANLTWNDEVGSLPHGS